MVAKTMSIPRRPVGSGPRKSTKFVDCHSITPPIASTSINSQQGHPHSEHALLHAEPEEIDDVPRTNISECSLESIGLEDDDKIRPQVPPKDSRMPFKIINDSVPPIPQKDAARPAPGKSAFRLAEGAVQNTEIWRRRSTRSNSDLSFNDLKLSKSNGSTAGSPPRLPPPGRSLPLIPKQKSILRKTASRAPPPRPPPQPDFMGTNNSKLRRKQSHGSSTSPAHLSGRLPTPDYQKSDRRHSKTPNVLSPANPVSPPPDSDNHPPTGKRKPLKHAANLFKGPSNLVKKQSVPLLPQLSGQTSLESNAAHGHSRSSSDTFTISAPTENTVFSAPQPQKAHATARILAPHLQIVQMTHSPPPMVTSPEAITPYTARTIARKNEGIIHPGPAVDRSHFDCYHRHKYMRVSKNDKCPLGCMVCDLRDTEKRWNCTWCSLRICTGCMEVLAASGKDLKICVAKAGQTGRGLWKERQDTPVMG